jgi:hypothetical protein
MSLPEIMLQLYLIMSSSPHEFVDAAVLRQPGVDVAARIGRTAPTPPAPPPG